MEKPKVGQQVRTPEMRQVLREKYEGFRHSPESIEKIRESVTQWWKFRKQNVPVPPKTPYPFQIHHNVKIDFT